VSGPDGNGRDAGRPQLQIWDDERRESLLGTLPDGDAVWQVFVLVDPVSDNLVRGYLSFRLGEQRFDTAAVVVEETTDGVVERAAALPRSMLIQLLSSARD